MEHTSSTDKNKLLTYAGLIFVIIIWGIYPLIALRFYKYYSPTIRIAFSCLVCAIALLIISRHKLNLLNKTYFMVAIPTGFFLAVADILQKIGLLYTTPTHYAFLENLSCVVVPILLIFFVKKKPSFLTIAAALLCLLSSFVLTGVTADSGNISPIGDTLCALAGVFYGINIAGTGAFAKKLDAPLYLMIQMFTEVIISSVGAVVFDATGIEKIKFSFDLRLILACIVIAFTVSTLCWLIRTKAMKHVDASVVAVMMPFSSIITTIVSIFVGNDTLNANLAIGVVLGLIAIILSGLGDRKKEIQRAKPSVENFAPF